MKEKNPYDFKKLKDGSVKLIIRADSFEELEKNWFIAGFLFVTARVLLEKFKGLIR